MICGRKPITRDTAQQPGEGEFTLHPEESFDAIARQYLARGNEPAEPQGGAGRLTS
jgi:hypothetical protein